MRFLAVISLLLSLIMSGCRTAGPNAYGGGLFGGATGGLVGAAIGAENGNALEGAIIGGAIGSAIGTAAGNEVDLAEQRDQQIRQASHQQAVANAVSLEQVIKMTQSGLGDQVIANQIQSLGVVQRPSADQLVWLKSQNVSDSVLSALQTAPMAGSSMRPRRPIGPAAPVVVHEQVFVEPGCFVRPPRHFYRRPHRRRGAGVSFHF